MGWVIFDTPAARHTANRTNFLSACMSVSRNPKLYESCQGAIPM
jgi:hypothetical protein